MTALGRDFDRFWAAAAISNLGDGIRLTAIPLLAVELTVDPFVIGIVNASLLAPWLLFGAIGGLLADRGDRRRLILAGQLVRATAVGALAVAVASGLATIPLLIGAALVIGAGEIVVDSSFHAAVPQLVGDDQLETANGRIIAAMTVLDQVVGVGIAGALFAVAPGVPFAVDAATFAVAALLLTTIRRPLQGARGDGHEPVRTALAGGFRFIRDTPLLRGFIVSIPINNFGGNVAFAMLVLLVRSELGASEVEFSLVLAIGAIGGVLGSVAAAPLVGRFGRRAVLLSTPASFVAGTLVLAVAQAPWMVGVAFFVSSFGVVCFNIPGRALRQSITPDAVIGRVTSTFQMLGYGAGMAGAFSGGVIAATSSVRAANVVAAGIVTVAWAILARTLLRHLDTAGEVRSG